MFGQIPTPPTGAIESWLISAAAVGSLILLGMKLFVRKPPIEAEFVSKAEFRAFRDGVEREINGLRDKIDARVLNLGEKIDEMKSELLLAGERRDVSIHLRMNELEAGLARVDGLSEALRAEAETLAARHTLNRPPLATSLVRAVSRSRSRRRITSKT